MVPPSLQSLADAPQILQVHAPPLPPALYLQHHYLMLPTWIITITTNSNTKGNTSSTSNMTNTKSTATETILLQHHYWYLHYQ